MANANDLTAPVPAGYVRMAVTVTQQRQVIGQSHTHYNFMPWGFVEERDVLGLQSVQVSTGCECTGTARRVPLFATEQDILTKRVIPSWKGRFGAPA
jgi:hypothetical protein